MSKRNKWVFLVLWTVLGIVFMLIGLGNRYVVKKYAEKGIISNGRIVKLERTRSILVRGATIYDNIVSIEYIEPYTQYKRVVNTKEFIDDAFFDSLKIGKELEFVYLPNNQTQYAGEVIVKKMLDEMVSKNRNENWYIHFIPLIISILIGSLPLIFKK